MKKLIKNKQKIYMVPKDINGGLSTHIDKILGSTVEVTISKENLSYYKIGDVVEVFTVIDDGMLYFKPRVVDIDEGFNTVKVEFDKNKYDQLQRREYTRVVLEKEFTLTVDKKAYICDCLDLSAGGMKFATDASLISGQDYPIEFTLESKIPIQCFFQPIRISEKDSASGKSVVSGRFIALKNIDKIAIVQFCFKKQSENTNK